MRRRALMTLAFTAAATAPAHAQGLIEQLIDRLAATGRGADVFVQIATSGNNFEIESSRLLLARSEHPQIRDYAQRMIEQHGMMAEMLGSLPEASTRTPGAMNDSHTDRLLTLRRQESVDMLNRYYVEQQIEAHEWSVRAYETFAANGEVPALKAYAQRFLPMMREHLQAARALQLPQAG
jgi:putative membrane protein